MDASARYAGVTTRTGALVPEATLYQDLTAIERTGIKATLVPGSHPWGEQG